MEHLFPRKSQMLLAPTGLRQSTDQLKESIRDTFCRCVSHFVCMTLGQGHK